MRTLYGSSTSALWKLVQDGTAIFCPYCAKKLPLNATVAPTFKETGLPIAASILNAHMKSGAWLFAGSVQFIIALIVAEILYPNYNVSTNPLSDLGAGTFQPSSSIFNVSVIVFGALIVLGVYFVMKSFHRKPLVAMLVLAAIGVAGVGVLTETILGPRLLFSFMAFFFSGLAAILSFKVINSSFRYFAAVLGIVAMIALVLFIVGRLWSGSWWDPEDDCLSSASMVHRLRRS
jgi:hypothetical membrane protein